MPPTYAYPSIFGTDDNETLSVEWVLSWVEPLGDGGFTLHYSFYSGVFGAGGNDILYGTAAAPAEGSPFTDIQDVVLSGNEGDDQIFGGQGNDLLSGDSGSDIIHGGLGDDDIHGGGEGYADSLYGDGGNDTFYLVTDLTRLHVDGGEGLDTAIFSIGPIVLHDTAIFSGVELLRPDSHVRGTAQADRLDFSAFILLGQGNAPGHGVVDVQGLGGDDVIIGGTAADTLSGGEGDDTLMGGGGGDTLRGNAGNDTYLVVSGLESIIEKAGEGTDSVFFQVDAQSMPENVEIGYLSGAACSLTGHDGAEQLVANGALASTLRGMGGDDTLWGSALADTLEGGAGDDILRGQGGADVMRGGGGHDQYVVFDAGTVIEELPDEGTDTVWVTVSGFVIPDQVEIARLVTSGATITGRAGHDIIASGGVGNTLLGMAGDDEIWSSAAAETLDGGEGDDILRGQGGADHFIGGAGNDQFVVFDAASIIEEAADGGYDMAWITASGFVMPGEVEVGRLLDGAVSLTGSAMGENLVANPLLGSALSGMGGNDMLWGSAQADVFDGGTGDDIIYSYGGADRFLYGRAGWGADQISGFDRAQGMRIDLGGLGLNFAAIEGGFAFGGGSGIIRIGADSIFVYGADAFLEGDFLF